MTCPLTPEQQAAGNLASRTTKARKAKQAHITQLLNIRDVMYRDSVDMKLRPLERATAARAHDVVCERLRILSGAVKPGSRNVSVRELAPGEQQKRLPASRSRSDYLADAARVLAQAQANDHQAQAQGSAPSAPAQ